MAKKKPQHGGVREGAGRKPVSPEGKTMVVAATVPIVLVDELDALRTKEGWNRSEAVTRAIRLLLGKKS